MLGKSYRGTKSTTKKGDTCQRWDVADEEAVHQPREDIRDPNNFPHDASLSAAENYCRQPSSKPHKPWCYTTNPKIKWDYCDIPTCDDIGKYDKGSKF